MQSVPIDHEAVMVVIHWLVLFMVFDTTFNNVSVVSWQSVLLVVETGVPGENHRPVAYHWQTSVTWCCIEYAPHLSEIRAPNVSRSYGSWIFNYLCIQCLTPLKLWVLIPLMVRCTRATLCDRVCQWLVVGRWFSLGAPVSSANGTDSQDVAEVWLKVVLNTIALPYWSLLKLWCLFLPLSGELFLIQLYVIISVIIVEYTSFPYQYYWPPRYNNRGRSRISG